MVSWMAFLQAARLKTLPAALVPVCLGCVLAYSQAGALNWWMALCTLMGALFIQVSTNFFNDAIDADKGADTEKRLGPQRVTASGKMSRKAVYGCAFACLVLAAFFGWWMFLHRGFVMILIGLPSFYLAYGYTGGPLPLAYRGLGELFVLVFFGWIAVTGTVFVQLGEWQWQAFLLGSQVGLLSAMLILINNIRDNEEDRGSGKRTIVVLFGVEKALKLLIFMWVGCFGLGLLWYFCQGWPPALLPLAAAPLGWLISRRVSKALLQHDGAIFNRSLAFAAMHLLLFAVLWSAAMLFI